MTACINYTQADLENGFVYSDVQFSRFFLQLVKLNQKQSTYAHIYYNKLISNQKRNYWVARMEKRHGRKV